MKIFTLLCLIGFIVAMPLMAEADQQVIFEDDFSDNLHDWPLFDDDECTIQLDNGQYLFQHKRQEGAWLAWKAMAIDPQRDFSITATFTKVSGIDNDGYGIVWGLKDIDNYYQFTISGNGYYRYSKSVADEWTEVIEWTSSDLIKQGDGATNIISIRKTDQQVQFYINDQFLAEAAFEEFFGENVGFVVYNEMKIAIDHLLIEQPAVEPPPVEEPLVEQPIVEPLPPDQQPPVEETPVPLTVTESRVALVVGNSEYGETSLSTSVQDAHDMANILRTLGFYVIHKTNLTQSETKTLLAEFIGLSQNKEVALFYFSGYGAQIRKDNYVIPVGGDIRTEGHILYEGIKLADILAQMQKDAGNRINLVILDACREFKGVWLFNKGLAAIQAPAQTVVAYAAAPGMLTPEESGRNSVYTKYLLEALQTRGVPINQIFETVRNTVNEATNGQQTPWSTSAILREVSLNP